MAPVYLNLSSVSPRRTQSTVPFFRAFLSESPQNSQCCCRKDPAFCDVLFDSTRAIANAATPSLPNIVLGKIQCLQCLIPLESLDNRRIAFPPVCLSLLEFTHTKINTHTPAQTPPTTPALGATYHREDKPACHDCL